MMKLLNEIKELAPYLLIGFTIVAIIVVFLSTQLPSAKQLEPAATVMLKSMGKL